MKHKNPQGHVYTFSECESLLANRDSKKIDNNTWLRRVDTDTFAIQLHRTDVVRILRSGLYRLYSGGYQTNTTKDRLNRYSPANVYQTGGQWLVNGGGIRSKVHTFFDGITIDETGRVC